jgi:hypothetical protein
MLFGTGLSLFEVSISTSSHGVHETCHRDNLKSERRSELSLATRRRVEPTNSTLIKPFSHRSSWHGTVSDESRAAPVGPPRPKPAPSASTRGSQFITRSLSQAVHSTYLPSSRNQWWPGNCLLSFMRTNSFEDSRVSEGTMLPGAQHITNTTETSTKTSAYEDGKVFADTAPSDVDPNDQENRVRRVLGASTLTGDRVRN